MTHLAASQWRAPLATLAVALAPLAVSASVITNVTLANSSPDWADTFSFTGTSMTMHTAGGASAVNKQAVFHIEVDGGAGSLLGDTLFGCLVGDNLPGGGARSDCLAHNGYTPDSQVVGAGVEFDYLGFHWFTADISGNTLTLSLNAPPGGIAYVGFNYYFELPNAVPSAVLPEPTALALVGLALGGLGVTRRRAPK